MRTISPYAVFLYVLWWLQIQAVSLTISVLQYLFYVWFSIKDFPPSWIYGIFLQCDSPAMSGGWLLEFRRVPCLSWNIRLLKQVCSFSSRNPYSSKVGPFCLKDTWLFHCLLSLVHYSFHVDLVVTLHYILRPFCRSFLFLLLQTEYTFYILIQIIGLITQLGEGKSTIVS